MTETAELAVTLQRLRQDYEALLARLEANRGEFIHLARAVHRLQEDERRRLARELHDDLGASLTALKHQLGLALDTLDEAAAAPRRHVQQALATCARTLEDTRRIARLLRPQILDDLGLAAALRWLLHGASEHAGLHCEFEDAELPALDDERQTVVFRVVQEGLTNVVRHAGAKRVVLRIACAGGWLRLTLDDDGCGLDKASADGSGLGGMRERLRLYGGDMQLGRSPLGGCRLQIALPVASEP